MQADPQAIRAYFERVHGGEPQGWLILWTRQDKATRAFDLRLEAALDEAVEYAVSRAAASDVYAEVGLQAKAPPRGSRGKEDGVVALPGVWADIDIGGAAHKSSELPKTEAEALSLI